jgi:hypothetical protein
LYPSWQTDSTKILRSRYIDEGNPQVDVEAASNGRRRPVAAHPLDDWFQMVCVVVGEE